jgi:hypothetical protein
LLRNDATAAPVVGHSVPLVEESLYD